jgi:hypothetical protein
MKYHSLDGWSHGREFMGRIHLAKDDRVEELISSWCAFHIAFHGAKRQRLNSQIEELGELSVTAQVFAHANSDWG